MLRFLSLVLFSQLVFATYNCGHIIETIFIAEKIANKSSIEIPANSAVKSLKILGEDVSKKDIEVITSIIREVNQEILSHTKVVKQVEKINLQVNSQDSNAFFMGFGQHILYSVRQISIPAKEVDGSVRMVVEHPIKTEPVTAHEFGHAVVNKTMYDNVAEYRQFVNAVKPVVQKQLEVKELAEKGKPLQKELHDLLKKYFPQKSVDEVELEDFIEIPELVEAYDSFEAFMKIFMEAQNELRELNHMAMKSAGKWQAVQAIFGAHNEFYADVIALAYTKSNPDAISDALSNVRHYQLDHDHSEIRAVHRNFEHRNNRVDRWQQDQTIHHRFAPTRYHVYHYYMKQPSHTRPKIQAQILDNIMRAIIKDMQQRMKLGGVGRSPVEDNEHLIKLIDEMFEKYPIDYTVYDTPMF